MRNHHPFREPTMPEHAEALLAHAQIVVTGRAAVAVTATDPWIDGALLADLDAFSVGPVRNDAAGDFVADGARRVTPRSFNRMIWPPPIS